MLVKYNCVAAHGRWQQWAQQFEIGFLILNNWSPMLAGREEDVRSFCTDVQFIIQNENLVGFNGGRLGCEIAVSQ